MRRKKSLRTIAIGIGLTIAMIQGVRLYVFALGAPEEVKRPVSMLAWGVSLLLALGILLAVCVRSGRVPPDGSDRAEQDPSNRRPDELPEGYRMMGRMPGTIEVAEVKGLDGLFQGAPG